MSGAQPPRRGTYLYCVTRVGPFQQNGSGIQATGIAGQPVRMITQGDLAAFVSDSPADEYDITHENVTAHESAIEQVMQHADVLPVSFGTVAASDDEVRERLLRHESENLRSQLERVRNRVELGLKVLWEEGPLFSQIITEDPELQALREQIVGTTPEETYDIRIRIGELTDAAIQSKREQETTDIMNALAPLTVDSRINNIITDLMILNAAFLVDKSQVRAFGAKVDEMRQSSQGRLNFQFVGPLPPYNFVTVTVHWEEPSNAVTQ